MIVQTLACLDKLTGRAADNPKERKMKRYMKPKVVGSSNVHPC